MNNYNNIAGFIFVCFTDSLRGREQMQFYRNFSCYRYNLKY